MEKPSADASPTILRGSCTSKYHGTFHSLKNTSHNIFYGVENSRTGEGQYTESKSAKSSIDRRSNAEPHQKFQHRITPCPNLSPQIMECHWTNQAIGARESIRNPRGDRLSCSDFCFSRDLGPYLLHKPNIAQSAPPSSILDGIRK